MSSGEYSGSMNLPPWLRTKDKLPAFYVFTHLVKGARGGDLKSKLMGLYLPILWRVGENSFSPFRGRLKPPLPPKASPTPYLRLYHH